MDDMDGKLPQEGRALRSSRMFTCGHGIFFCRRDAFWRDKHASLVDSIQIRLQLSIVSRFSPTYTYTMQQKQIRELSSFSPFCTLTENARLENDK